MEGPVPGLSKPVQYPAWLLHFRTHHAALLDAAARAILSATMSALVLSEGMNVPRGWKNYKSNFLFAGHNGELTGSVGNAKELRVLYR